MDRRTFLAALAASGLLPRAAAAQPYPAKPIRLIVTFAAGGPADLFGRALAAGMSTELGQQVVVESRTGAGGLTGLSAAAHSTPDGYTLCLAGAAALSTIPFMMASMPFDWKTELTPLTLVARVPEVLVVNPSLGVATLPELVAHAKAKPRTVNFGSAGVGSITHLAGELLRDQALIDVVHVPYRGAAPAVNDLLGGHVQFVIADIPVLLPHIQAGAVKPLAVTTAKRTTVLPEVPTTTELGYPGVLSDNWYGLVAPGGLPSEIAAVLHKAATATLRSDELARQFETQAAIPSPTTGAEFVAFIESEQAKWGPLVKSTGARL
jgi:tripartite-type tricarboxylate transporter receptor subunit TctC